MADSPVSRLNAALEGRYRIERELGEGGMATVYLADDLKHKRRVAVKVFRPELAAQLGTDRFVREIEITAGLTHPHILPVLDSGQADGLSYYVMPFIEGESLRDRLDREGPLPIAEALSIAREVGEALVSAHGHGVIHRDVKPGNILITDGGVYVADFGVARAISAAGGSRLTATGMAVGTPAYMSPEQASGSDRVDHRTDQFSLGCVLYEMLTGEAPHAASTPQAVIARVITAPPTLVSTLRESVPPHVEAAVHRALEKAPADRFAGIAEMLKALRGEDVATVSSESLRRRGPGGRRQAFTLAGTAGAALLVGAVAVGFLLRDTGGSGTLQEVRSAIQSDDPETAYRIAMTMDPVDIPDSVWALFTAPATIVSDPAGATVSRRPYAEPDGDWVTLGTTPLSIDRFPSGSSVLRLEADGYRVAHAAFSPLTTDTIVLDPVDDVAEGWRTIQGDLPDYLGGPEFAFRYIAPNLSLAPTIRLHDFQLARHEVTNAEYREFVSAGGYEDPSYWEHELVRDGRAVPWDEAMQEFTDSTGRPGPSTWRFGSYPDGRADHPVTGVSWYEAAAYARYAGKELPTAYHWFRAATTWLSDWMIPFSNMEGDAPMPVGANAGISQFGIHDMAGNAREWAFNATGAGRFILGGGWSDSRYVFTVANGAPPFDRSPLNGIRLADYAAEADEIAAAREPIPQTIRDFSGEVPVSDETFASFIRLYEYDPAPLDAVVHSADTTDLWIREYVTFDATYGTERTGLYLYMPRNADGPLQTVVYYPGSGALWLGSFDQYPTQHAEMVVRSGRAFAFPVFQSTFNREDGFVYRRQDETNSYRDHVFHWARDLGRTVDYLETRAEIDADRLAYMGFSWGGMLAPIMLVTEPRLKVAVLVVPGLSPLPTQPEVDAFHFVTRTTQPVLMLSGEYDMVHPLETSARPMFRLWNADPAEKRHVVVDRAHGVPLPALTRETVAWLDRFLGPE